MAAKKIQDSKAYKNGVSRKGNVKSFVKEVEEESEKVIEEVREVLESKKVRRLEHYIVFFMYFVVFLIGAYFLVISFIPEVLPEEFYSYEILAGDLSIGNNLRSLYLADVDALGGVTKVAAGSGNESDGEEVEVRMVVWEKPFYFVFNPKSKLDENATALIELSFVNPRTEIYLNDKLIVPDLSGFRKVADFPDEAVYVRDELAASMVDGGEWAVDSGLPMVDGEGNYSNAWDFVYGEFPGMDYYVFGEGGVASPVLSDYNKSLTSINTRFRDDLKLAVYAEGDLYINFTKQDLNICVGKDEYVVEIVDLNGNVYFSEVYEDDGDKKDDGDGDNEQKLSIEVSDLPKGVYYVVFTRDENNKWEDSSIKDISINSNKVLIVGKIFPIGEFEFYTEILDVESIRFKTYWRDKISLEINGSLNYTFEIKKMEDAVLELPEGRYTLYDNGWNVWISQNPPFAPSMSQWFDLPNSGNMRELTDQDIIVIDKSVLEISGNRVLCRTIIYVKEGENIKLQALDSLRVYFVSLKLELLDEND